MKKISLLVACIAFQLGTSAQRLTMDWEANPTPHKIANEKFLKESAIIITEKNQLELSKNLQGNVDYTHRIHKIIRVNDEKGIESFNKIKISYSEYAPIVLIKARTISPSGKVVELKGDAFKDMKEEDGSTNKIFALEGVEKGSEIEYVVYRRKNFVLFGTEYMQDVVPSLENWFELVSNDFLIFDIKGYNGAMVEKDSVVNNKHSFLAYSKNMIGLEEEKYASYSSHFARVEYALAYNTNQGGKEKRIYTWDDIMKNNYKAYTTFTDKELKEGKKILDNKEYTALNDTKSKVAWIEHWVKTNIVQQEYVQANNADAIAYILKNKLTNESGIKNIFALLCTSDDIAFEMGYSSNRFIKPFDYNFINPDNLTTCLFYFPAIKQYVAPNETMYRTPYFPPNCESNASVFTKIVKLGSIVTATAENRTLPHTDDVTNYHNHDVTVNFSPDIDTAIINIQNSFHGHNMIELLPAFIFLEKEKRDDAAKDILRVSEKDEKMDNFKYENNEFKYIATEDKPLKVSATIHATNNIEKAGNKYLFKIGELIGRQAEMYQEKERQFDLEISNPHHYDRNIKVIIPNGYKANNLDKLNMNVVCTTNGKENCKFVSSYTLNGNELNVKVYEVYHETFTSKSEYEPYRKVINAAADFNKIVIVLEKM